MFVVYNNKTINEFPLLIAPLSLHKVELEYVFSVDVVWVGVSERNVLNRKITLFYMKLDVIKESI